MYKKFKKPIDKNILVLNSSITPKNLGYIRKFSVTRNLAKAPVPDPRGKRFIEAMERFRNNRDHRDPYYEVDMLSVLHNILRRVGGGSLYRDPQNAREINQQLARTRSALNRANYNDEEFNQFSHYMLDRGLHRYLRSVTGLEPR